MPWGVIELNDGRKIPEVAFGSAKGRTVDHLVAALDAGFTHLDTAQREYSRNDICKPIYNPFLRIWQRRSCRSSHQGIWCSARESLDHDQVEQRGSSGSRVM